MGCLENSVATEVAPNSLRQTDEKSTYQRIDKYLTSVGVDGFEPPTLCL